MQLFERIERALEQRKQPVSLPAAMRQLYFAAGGDVAEADTRAINTAARGVVAREVYKVAITDSGAVDEEVTRALRAERSTARSATR